MGTGTGLQASFGYKAETVVGTAVTVDKWNDYDGGILQVDQKWTDPAGLAAGRLVPLSARWQQTTRSGGGSIPMDFAVKDMSRLIKQCLGSSLSSPTLISGAAYRHIHQIGSTQGQSMTWQFGQDQRDGTTRAFTASGVKVSSWKIGSSEGNLVKLTMDAMAKDVVTSTALATPSYATGNELFHHQQLAVKIGGTASTSTGLVSISGGVAMSTTVKDIEFTGEVPLSESYGTSQTMLEPLQNGLINARCAIGGEFTSRSEIYDVWRAGTAVPLQATWTGSTISGGNYTLDVIFSSAKIVTEDLGDSSPDIVPEKFSLRAGSDGTNSAVQVVLVTTDAAL